MSAPSRFVLWASLVALLVLLAPLLISLGQAGPNDIPAGSANLGSRVTKRHYVKLNTIIDRPVTLTVNNGMGGGDYAIGSLVRVSANDPPEGKRFSRWTGDIVILVNPFIATTTAIVPPIPVTVTASYRAVDAATESPDESKQ